MNFIRIIFFSFFVSLVPISNVYATGFSSDGSADDLSDNNIDDLSDVTVTSDVAADILVRNAGDTAYVNVAVSGDATIAATGALTIAANSVALTTDTTGNYAAGDAEAGAALTGDSATSFFSAGQIESARGGTGLDTSASTGIARLSTGTWSVSELSGDVVTSGSNAATIQANSVALTTDTTGNYMVDVAGTANEITSTHTPAEGSTATLSLPATIDLGGKTSFEVPNAAAPTVDVLGELAADNDAWAASRGALTHYDGTATTFVIASLTSDTPTNGQVPKWNTGGTITWEADNDTGGSTAWSAIGDAAAAGDVLMAEYVQSLSWDSAATAAAYDALTIQVTHDSTTDSSTQRAFVVERLASTGTAAWETLLQIQNNDTDGAVTTGLEILSAAGVITTAIDVSDAEITTAIAIGSNDTTVGGVTISSAEFAVLDTDIALTTETSGNYVASVATTSPITGGAAGSEGATLTLSIVDDSITFAHISDSSAIDVDTTFTAADGIQLTLTPTHTSGDTNFFTIDANQTDDAAATDDFDAFRLDLTSESGDAGDTFDGIVLIWENGTANTIMDSGLKIDNAELTAATMTDAIIVTSSGVNEGVTDAIDVSATNILNAINVGANPIISGANTLTLGNSSATSLTVTTDSTGDAEVSLPTGSISSGEILDATILNGDIAADTIDGTALDDSITLDANTSFGDGGTTDYTTISTTGVITYAGAARPLRTIILLPGGSVASTAAAALATIDGTNEDYRVLDFDAATDEQAFWTFMLPDSYNGGTVSVTIRWQAGATTNDTIWNVQMAAVADAEAVDVAQGTAATATDTTKGTANQLNDTSAMTVTIAGTPAAGELVHCRVIRDADAAGDNMTGDARLVMVKIEYTAIGESD